MTQPEALRLADLLEQIDGQHWQVQDSAAAELRRLHEANEEFGKRQEWWNERMFVLEQQRDALLEALKLSRAQWIHSVNSDHCLAAIKAVEENT